MNLGISKKNGIWIAAGALGVAAGVAAYVMWRRAQELVSMEELANEPRSASPETPKGTAFSAVTGGLPEDINEMPPTNNFEEEGPIYDGHDIAPPMRAER